MTKYATNNPIGSMDPKDLFDNAQNLDFAVNDFTKAIWKDRFGRDRKTYWGMEQAFSAQLLSQKQQLDAQIFSQQQRFDLFIQSSGYKVIGEYNAGPLTINDLNQLIRHENEFWKLDASTPVPFTTTGNDSASWVIDSTHFVSVSDAALRQELAEPGGADMIGAQQPFPGSVYRTVQDKFREVVSIKDFGGNGDGSTINDTAFQKAMSLAETKPISLYIPPGIFKITETQALSLSGDISFKMFGAGSGISVILVETGGDGFIFNTPGNYSLWNTGPGRTTIELSGLSIATAQELVGVGIAINGNHVTGRPSATIIFNDVNVTSYSGASSQFFDTGIMLRNCSNVIFNNVHMYLGSRNTTSKGVYSFSESISNGGGALHFTDCTFLFGGNQLWVGDQQEGVYITNCEFVGGSVAVRYEPDTAQSGLHVIGCHMSSRDYNIYIHRLYHFEIIGGLYFNLNVNPAFMHIYCDVVNQFTISSSVFSGRNGASERGVHIGSATDGAGNGGVITGNMFANLNIGVSLSSASNNIKESANLYRNCTKNVSDASASGNNILDYSQYHNTQTFALGGGATSETVHVTVNAAVFKKKPVSAIMNCPSNSGMVGFYDYTNSTTTDLVFIIRRIDEAIIPANSYRFSISAFGTP